MSEEDAQQGDVRAGGGVARQGGRSLEQGGVAQQGGRALEQGGVAQQGGRALELGGRHSGRQRGRGGQHGGQRGRFQVLENQQHQLQRQVQQPLHLSGVCV